MLSRLKKYIRNNIKKEYTIDDYRELGVKIGENCTIYSSNIDRGHSYLIEIGNNCTLTHCTILAHDASTKKYLKKSKVGLVTIGDNSIGVGNPCKIISNTNDFIKKNKEFLKTKPVFDTYWKNKSEEEKENEKELLKDTFGFDE